MNENEQDTDLEEEEEVPAEEQAPAASVVKKTFWDYNLSWVLIIALAAAAIWIGQVNSSKVDVGRGNPVVYLLLQVVLSIAAGTLFYCLGKIAFGYLSGYRLAYVQAFGVRLSLGRKRRISMPRGIWGLADFRLAMAPRKENPNPALMFLGGPVMVAILQGIMVGIGFAVKDKAPLFHMSTLFAIGYVALVILYQWIPVRIDLFNDGFLMIKTRKPDDRKAYNTYLANIEAEDQNLPVIVADFSDYGTYMKANCLYYNYLSELYRDHLEAALDYLNKALYYSPYLSFENVIKVKGERLFVLLLADLPEQADKTFRAYTHDERVELEKHTTLSSYRIALLTAGIIETEYERVNRIVADFEECKKKIGASERLDKESALFELCLAKIKLIHPEWDQDSSAPETAGHTVTVPDEDDEEDDED